MLVALIIHRPLTFLFQMNPWWFTYTSAMLTTVGVLKHSSIARLGSSLSSLPQYGVKSLAACPKHDQQVTKRVERRMLAASEVTKCFDGWKQKNYRPDRQADENIADKNAHNPRCHARRRLAVTLCSSASRNFGVGWRSQMMVTGRNGAMALYVGEFCPRYLDLRE